MTYRLALDDDGPTPEDLDAIEAEWPLIDAELALTAAEIAVLTAVHGPDALAWRRLRRAEHRVAAEATAYAARLARDGCHLDAAPARDATTAGASPAGHVMPARRAA